MSAARVKFIVHTCNEEMGVTSLQRRDSLQPLREVGVVQVLAWQGDPKHAGKFLFIPPLLEKKVFVG